MAKDLLDATNEILTRVGVIAGDAGELTSLTDSSRQAFIDVAIQVVNEGLDDLYSVSREPKPKQQAESTITLATNIRSYKLKHDMVQLLWPMIDKTNNQYLYEHKGGFNSLLIIDPEQDDTGLPLTAAISPRDGKLHLDRAPTTNEAGRVYTYQYNRDLALELASDVFPFTDAVFRAMVPAWVQLWKREKRNEFDGDLFKVNVGRAARLLRQAPQNASWWSR